MKLEIVNLCISNNTATKKEVSFGRNHHVFLSEKLLNKLITVNDLKNE